jgi:hypothetical protein
MIIHVFVGYPPANSHRSGVYPQFVDDFPRATIGFHEIPQRFRRYLNEKRYEKRSPRGASPIDAIGARE